MKDTHIFEDLLAKTRNSYSDHPEMAAFASFPIDIEPQPIEPFHCPCSDFLCNEKGLFPEKYAALHNAILAAAPFVHWRQTYKDSGVSQYFMDRFGCYSIIGPSGPFKSAALNAWIVYLPPHLYYPLHHHPAEEMYLVIAGEAQFIKDGFPNQVFRAGDTSFHESNQPHAMETKADPVLCLVTWRNGFENLPILTSQA